MKKLITIFVFIASVSLYGKDSTLVRKKLNYLEFNVNSGSYFKTYYSSLSVSSAEIYYPEFYIHKLYGYHSINGGIKMGHHKLTVGLEFNPIYNSQNPQYPYNQQIFTSGYKPNIKATYGFYFSKYRKRWNHLVYANFALQNIKDYTDYSYTVYENKKGTVLGFGYGVGFYIKQCILIEPSLQVNALFYNKKMNYTSYTQPYITYRQEITPEHHIYTGLNIKIAYIIPLKNK